MEKWNVYKVLRKEPFAKPPFGKERSRYSVGWRWNLEIKILIIKPTRCTNF